MLDRLVEIGVNAIFVTLHTPAGAEYLDDDRKKSFCDFLTKLELDCVFDRIVPLTTIVSDIDYKGMRLLVQAHNWGVIGTDRGGTVPGLSAQARIAPCVRPLREFTVSYDGGVYQCCQIFPRDKNTAEYKIGTVSQSCNIFDVYASVPMAAWRRKLFTFGPKPPPCATCSDQDPLRSSVGSVEGNHSTTHANCVSFFKHDRNLNLLVPN